MLPGKRGHADLQKVPADKRLRLRIGNLLQLRFCPGSRPAVRGCGSLWRQPCQRHGCSCQQAKGQGPSQEGHLAQAVKNRHWPPLYSAQLPLWDTQQQKDVLGAAPLWLPHELLYKLQGKAANDSSMRNLDTLEEGELQLLRQCAEKACVAPTSCRPGNMGGRRAPDKGPRSERRAPDPQYIDLC